MEIIDNQINHFLKENRSFSSLSKKAVDQLLKWDNNNDKKEIVRPGWDDVFLVCAFVIAQRSVDGRTKHGTVLVKDNRILSCGYNGYMPGIRDDVLPNLSHEKLPFVVHSEENSIINSARNGQNISGATAYITGPPCCGCLQKLITANIKKIVHGNKKSVSLEQDESYKINREIIDWLTSGNISIIERKIDENFVELLGNVLIGATKSD